MSGVVTNETIVPLFPCGDFDETLGFYQALGFEIRSRQDDPYCYAEVHRRDIVLHFAKLSAWRTQRSTCLVFVDAVAPLHRAFADALRLEYGKVPTAGFPRITRLRPAQTRFHLFDPAGNVLLYIEKTEPPANYDRHATAGSRLSKALENAIFLRDTYTNDDAAARVLDRALAEPDVAAPAVSYTPLRARALAARAELAVALGQIERAEALQRQLEQLPLTEQERSGLHDELTAAANLERWIIEAPTAPGGA
jgi:hypothetical protein